MSPIRWQRHGERDDYRRRIGDKGLWLRTAGGTNGACDGVMALDWNAFVAANPSSLGAPFSAGADVWAQLYFRDPPAPKTTSLSDGLQFTLCP